MRKREPEKEVIFWVTIIISLALLVHNGLEPVFIFAYCLIPILILSFYYRRNLLPLALYLLIFGVLGRYTRYFRQNYASDVLLATRDFIGFLLAGKNPYNQLIFVGRGLIPFAYLPFELLWYLPAQVLMIDLRFFEMVIAALVPLEVFLYGILNKKWQILPILSVISLTPFLLDLSADGSNDNSAIFILLLSILLLIYSRKRTSQKMAFFSAIVLGLALAFKHYIFFYFIFLTAFLWEKKNFLPITNKKYFWCVLITAIILIAPFILTAPAGFFRSQLDLENRVGFSIWGWNIWNIFKGIFTLPDKAIQSIRGITTIATIGWSLFFLKLNRFNKVFISTALSILVYLVFSKWTTYAYFSFLIPLFGLSAINIEGE